MIKSGKELRISAEFDIKTDFYHGITHIQDLLTPHEGTMPPSLGTTDLHTSLVH
jgi:hypothetical protein